ncbi:MAG: hypothetical protein ACEPO8_05555 [Rhodothermaceae bacterium]
MKNLIYGSLLNFFLIGCVADAEQIKTVENKNNLKIVEEYGYQEIKLSGDVSEKYSEISGLAWHNDDLFFVTQYPGNYAEGEEGVLWKVSKQEIYKAIENPEITLAPKEVKLNTNGMGDVINSRGSGLEAIVFDGETVYLSIENSDRNGTNGIIVKGELNNEKNEITLLPESAVKIEHEVNISNFAEETLTQTKDHVISIFEGNGKEVYPNSKAHLISKKTGEITKIPIEHLEYRVTDATELDENGNFWVINFLYPGEKTKLKLCPDTLVAKFGIGKTHNENEQVERLVEFNFDGEKLQLTETPPIQLKLEKDSKSNNWEGIVRLDDKGFLLITDYYPGTKLVFVPYSK